MSLAEHIILMNRGRVAQQGPPVELYGKPRSKFVAEFIGRSNWFEGRLSREASPGVWEYETTEGLRLLVPPPAGPVSGRYEVGVRPERIAVDRGAAPADASLSSRPNAVTGTVDYVENLGSDVHIWIHLTSGRRIRVVEKNVDQRLERAGAPIVARFAVSDCIVVAPEDESK